MRGLLKTFGVLFGKRVGGFMRRAEEIIAGELAVAPELRAIFEAQVAARCAILQRIRALDAQVRDAARRSQTVRLFMSAPGVGPITAPRSPPPSTMPDGSAVRRAPAPILG